MGVRKEEVTSTAADRFRDDLMAQVQFLVGRIDQLSKQVDSQQQAYAALRQEYGKIESEHRELQRAYIELEEKYANQKRELERVREVNESQSRDLEIAKRMLRQVYNASPPTGRKWGGPEET